MPDQDTDNPTPPDAEPTAPTKRAPRTPSSETKPAPDSTTKKGKKQKPEPTTPMGKLWHGWIKPIGSVVIVVVLIRSSLIDWNDVPTGSMEPEIHVGDRIAVNRLAYAFQFPLTGPQIGVPFTPLQWDNPLDGIPQIQYAEPQRGDIVTFWNPISKVRMVKRIVAKPGDTISMTGGVLTINGTTATYVELDATAEGLEPITKYYEQSQGSKTKKLVIKDLHYQTETLLDEERTVQHIKERWLDEVYLIERPDGMLEKLGATITENYGAPDPSNPSRLIPMQREVQIDDYLRNRPGIKLAVRFIDGTPMIDGKPASYNELAQTVLEPFKTGAVADKLDEMGLGIDGHEFLIAGEPVPYEFFKIELVKQFNAMNKNEQALLAPLQNTLDLLQTAMSTTFGPITLGDDDYFMVGDNRNNSHDSRFFGPVKRSEITGKAFAIAFSFNDNKMFALPPDPAWERFFKDLD